MGQLPRIESIRTMVVIEQGDKRHVMEIAAEATITYDDPNDLFAPSWLPPVPIERHLGLEGLILRHVVFDMSYQPDLFRGQTEVEASRSEIEVSDEQL